MREGHRHAARPAHIGHPRHGGDQPAAPLRQVAGDGGEHLGKADRHRKVTGFVDAFFGNFDAFLRPPRHPKWREVNLAARVPGWTRLRSAEEAEARLRPAR